MLNKIIIPFIRKHSLTLEFLGRVYVIHCTTQHADLVATTSIC